jgi:hypothetical protein
MGSHSNERKRQEGQTPTQLEEPATRSHENAEKRRHQEDGVNARQDPNHHWFHIQGSEVKKVVKDRSHVFLHFYSICLDDLYIRAKQGLES